MPTPHDANASSRSVRMAYRQDLARMGRWLAVEHPQVTEPAQWTRATCAAWVATVDRMRIGDYVERTATRGDFGDPMSPSSKDSAFTAGRAFFRNLQEWEWIPRRFDPGHALETPRSIRALLGPNPRVIADEVRAKLLWAGINLTSENLPTTSSGPRYPLGAFLLEGPDDLGIYEKAQLADPRGGRLCRAGGMGLSGCQAGQAAASLQRKHTPIHLSSPEPWR